MLRAYVLSWKGSWEDHMPLVEFAYNNTYQASIRLAPYEVLGIDVFVYFVGIWMVGDL